MKLKILLHRFSSFPCYLHMLAHASMDCFFCLPSCKALRNIWAKHRSENNRHKRFQLIFLKGHLVSCCPNRPTDCNNEQSTQKILPRTENIKHRHGLPNRRRVGVLRTTTIIPHTNFGTHEQHMILPFQLMTKGATRIARTLSPFHIISSQNCIFHLAIGKLNLNRNLCFPNLL
jgi:hypothetical protein